MADAPTHCPKCRKDLSVEQNFCPACGEDVRGLSPTADTLTGPVVERIIDGRYRLLEKLGEGGMGAVYKVEHVRMGKLLALKLLRPDNAIDKRLKQRFIQEARIVSRLSHPNTVQVFDFGELADGSLYLAMEYLPGRDLAWTLRARGPMVEEKAIAIGMQVLASLGEAHDKGIIHRDIKPANVMLVKRAGGEDQAKVLDFGIAKLAEAEGRKHITGLTDFVGTPSYMAPEQASGEEVDARTDLYSVGALLFELVTGRSVFVGPTAMSVVTQLASATPPRLADVAPSAGLSSAFEHVVHKALSKRPADRYGSAAEMSRALDRVRRETSSQSQDLTPMSDELATQLASRSDFDQFERSLRLRRLFAPLVLLLVLALLGAAGLRFFAQRPRTEPVEAEREPNDVPGQANRIALGLPVKGKIGPPLTQRDSDNDLYWLAPTDVPVAITLSGIAGLDLAFALMEGESGSGLKVLVDDAREAEGERLDGYRLQTDAGMFVRVKEVSKEPRESSVREYQLLVTPTDGVAPLEVEPDDTPAQARARYGADQPVTAFTGAPLEFPPREEWGGGFGPSTVDFFFAAADGGSEPWLAAVVAPPGMPLAVVDAADWERWSAGRAGQAQRSPPTPMLLGGQKGRGADALPLDEASGRRGIRVQPLPGAAAGAPYQVVFAHGGPSGLVGVLELSRRLLRDGRQKEARELEEALAQRLPAAPQLAQLRQLRRR